ncbi:MAG: hypothetical protein JWL77_3284 [Chthonomonadaceae bacterium]|nr:hypothetical protein [Chthonomonadaceae bacterium]
MPGQEKDGKAGNLIPTPGVHLSGQRPFTT